MEVCGWVMDSLGIFWGNILEFYFFVTVRTLSVLTFLQFMLVFLYFVLFTPNSYTFV